MRTCMLMGILWMATAMNGAEAKLADRHWAYQKPIRPALPRMDSDWPRKAIDFFVLLPDIIVRFSRFRPCLVVGRDRVEESMGVCLASGHRRKNFDALLLRFLDGAEGFLFGTDLVVKTGSDIAALGWVNAGHQNGHDGNTHPLSAVEKGDYLGLHAVP